MMQSVSPFILIAYHHSLLLQGAPGAMTSCFWALLEKCLDVLFEQPIFGYA